MTGLIKMMGQISRIKWNLFRKGGKGGGWKKSYYKLGHLPRHWLGYQGTILSTTNKIRNFRSDTKYQ